MPICRAFAQDGYCKYGSNCKFTHVLDDRNRKPTRNNAGGYDNYRSSESDHNRPRGSYDKFDRNDNQKTYNKSRGNNSGYDRGSEKYHDSDNQFRNEGKFANHHNKNNSYAPKYDRFESSNSTVRRDDRYNQGQSNRGDQYDQWNRSDDNRSNRTTGNYSSSARPSSPQYSGNPSNSETRQGEAEIYSPGYRARKMQNNPQPTSNYGNEIRIRPNNYESNLNSKAPLKYQNSNSNSNLSSPVRDRPAESHRNSSSSVFAKPLDRWTIEDYLKAGNLDMASYNPFFQSRVSTCYGLPNGNIVTGDFSFEEMRYNAIMYFRRDGNLENYKAFINNILMANQTEFANMDTKARKFGSEQSTKAEMMVQQSDSSRGQGMNQANTISMQSLTSLYATSGHVLESSNMPRLEYYSEIDKLSREDLEAFKADAFVFGKIPEVPPPKNLI